MEIRITNAIKVIGLLLLFFSFQSSFSQIDLFTEEEDEEEINDVFENVSYDEFMNATHHVLSDGQAGPIANWMGGSLELMADPRFGDAPKEYNCAYMVRSKVLKMLAYDAMLDQLDLSCEKTKEVLESYIMFIGTLYLDMFSTDYFAERDFLSRNEFSNVQLAIKDAKEKFENGVISRMDVEVLNEVCESDLDDITVTDCNCNLPEWSEEVSKKGYKTLMEYMGLPLLHPASVMQLTMDLQSRLNSLPCNE